MKAKKYALDKDTVKIIIYKLLVKGDIMRVRSEAYKMI